MVLPQRGEDLRSSARKPHRSNSGRMRKTISIAAFAALAIASPVSAQSDAADALEAIDSPERVEMMAETVEDVTAALLAIPMGPLIDAMRRIDPDAAYDVPDDATLGEIARADADLPERIGDETRIGGEIAGQAARDLAIAMPVIEAMASDLAAQWRQRIADARRNQRR
jgi:hypothetical protein